MKRGERGVERESGVGGHTWERVCVCGGGGGGGGGASGGGGKEGAEKLCLRGGTIGFPFLWRFV